MALISGVNLRKFFGGMDLFNNLSFQIDPKARIGLVGANGVGKTTLLKIIAGEDTDFEGHLFTSRGLKIGYLPQLSLYMSEKMVWDEMVTVFSSLLAMQEKLRAIEREMTGNQPTEDLLGMYAHLQSRFEHDGGYIYEQKIRQTLSGLGFSREDERRPWSQLSGGQRTRALLAKLLLEEPQLLLLDEPTNHLDMSAVEWLEAYLKEWRGAYLIVSHDRYLLDQVVDSIWEMTPRLENYKGNYSAFLLQRAERSARKQAELQARKKFVEKEEEFIRKNIAGQNTRQAQGRRKRLERVAQQTDPIRSTQKMRFRLGPDNRSGNLVLRTSELRVGYQDDGKTLFETQEINLNRQECAAIIGPNGVGKTTFLKTILGQIPALAGEVNLGANVKIGYFAQVHEELIHGQTLMQIIERAAPQMLPGEIRDYLARFLFVGEDVFKQIELLSGGERGRLALAILALQGANLLLLDEPTNHLDIDSQEILEEMLRAYDGTILLVSHDRFLIDSLASQVWVLDGTKRQLTVFTGTYSEYRQSLADQTSNSTESTSRKIDPEKPIQNNERGGLSKNERMRLQQKLREIEDQISRLETEQALLESHLQQPVNDPQLIAERGARHASLQQVIHEALLAWEEIATALESKNEVEM